MKTQYFGEDKLSEIEYKLRKGAYAIILNSNYDLATVRSPRGNVLPGGALEGNENFKEALEREVLEEIGFEITMKDLIGTYGQYILASKQKEYYELLGNFYICELNALVNYESEEELELEWIKKEDIDKKLNLDYQLHAVLEVLKNKL